MSIVAGHDDRQRTRMTAGTDAGIVEKLRASYVETIKGPQVINRLAGAGFDIMQSTPTALADYMRSETEKWDEVIRSAGITADL